MEKEDKFWFLRKKNSIYTKLLKSVVKSSIKMENKIGKKKTLKSKTLIQYTSETTKKGRRNVQYLSYKVIS